MRVLLTGGGTGGSVTPLIAVRHQILKERPGSKFFFIGTKNGPEKKIAEEYEMPYAEISAGKLRRYFSWRNFLMPFELVAGFFQAYKIIKKFRPDAVFGAAGYVSVPVVLAAFVQRRKSIIHQQDVVPSLTNKILAPFASKITVTFQKSLQDFGLGSGLFSQEPKAIYTGNPIRDDFFKNFTEEDSRAVKEKYELTENLPVIYVSGGGTGALGLNLVLKDALPELVKFAYVIHSTGAGKQIAFKHERYKPFAFISKASEVLNIADIVVSRAGLATISELCILQKVSIIIPMPDSHQENNAELLDSTGSAVVLDQKKLTGQSLVSAIKKIMYDGELQREMSFNISKLMPRDAAKRVADVVIKVAKK